MIEIKVDGRDAVNSFRLWTAAMDKQLPFATSLAINNTTKAVQTAEREQLHKAFTLRRTDWAEKSVKITKFSTKNDLTATIGIHAPGDDTRSDILGKFETDAEKLPLQGTIAIPVSGLLAKGSAGILRNRARPRDVVASGKAFVIRKKMGTVGEGLILQRVTFGRGKSRRQTNVVLFYLVRRERLNPNLHFVDVATETINKRWEQLMTDAFDQAMSTAR